MRPDFAAFILTHGRAERVLTYRALKRSNYTGKIYLIVDNEDSELDLYKKLYGDEVVVFDKSEAALITDTCDNYGKRNSVVFARNWSFVIAKQLGLRYIWQLDDDYPTFNWTADNEGGYLNTTTRTVIKNLDAVLDACLQFFIASGAASIAFAQGGDFIGGDAGPFFRHWNENRLSRKAMNSFFLDVRRPVIFRGRVNDDVNAYVDAGRRGDLFITVQRLRLNQPTTQTAAGGCTDIYRDLGTYIKSFYSVMVAPSCVKAVTIGPSFRRIHHRVSWRHACPVIVDPAHRKP